jgi:hypothetical protein
MIVCGPMRIQLGMNPLYKPRSPSARTVYTSEDNQKSTLAIKYLKGPLDLNLHKAVRGGLVKGGSAVDNRLVHDPRFDHVHLRRVLLV